MPSRRDLLAGATSLGSLFTLAGCSGNLAPTPTDRPTATERPYPNLAREPLYPGPDLSLSLPEFVTVVETPADAAVVVLDPDTSVSGDRVAEWLEEEGLPVAVVGSHAERLFSLLKTGGVADRIDGYLATDEVFVVVGVDPVPGDWRTATGYNDDPDEGDLLRALDRTVAFLAEE